MSVSLPFSFYDKNCKLPSIYKKRGKKELNEESSQVSAHLQSFRRWITSMPHLKCPMDDEFLLAFLRHAKFNHAKAQRRLDNFCTFRTSEMEGAPSWFQSGEKRIEVWNYYMQQGWFLPLGFIPDGTAVMYLKLAKPSSETITYDDLLSAYQVWNDLLLTDARIQIAGMVFIIDLSGFSKKTLMEDWKPKDGKLNTKYFQEGLPFRVRQLIYYKTPSLFESLFKLISVWLNEKIKSRIMVLKDDLQPAFDMISGLKELVPKESGGNNESFADLLALSKDLMGDVPKYSPGFEISVDESKRPQGAKHLMREYKDIPDNLMGTSGTFIKLNEEEI